MYDSIVLTLILAALVWVAVGLQALVYILRQLLKLRRWVFAQPRVSDLLPRKAVKLSVPQYIAARVIAYAIIRSAWKKMK